VLKAMPELFPASDLGVGPSRCAADSTAQDYHRAVYICPLNTIADPAPIPTAMPASTPVTLLLRP
jgi:hypothetical protein